jgi:hypothetical protein
MQTRTLKVGPKYASALLGLVALLAGGAMALGQQPPGGNPPPAKGAVSRQKPAQPPALDQMIAEALRHNPDIRIAESKVHEAEAVLNQTRLQVIQKIVTLQHALEAQQAQVHLQEQQLRRCEQLHQTNAVPDEVVEAARQKLTAAKGKLSETEAELPYLLGRQDALKALSLRGMTDAIRPGELQPLPDSEAVDLANVMSKGHGPGSQALVGLPSVAAPSFSGSMAEQIRKALDTPVSVQADGQPLADVLAGFEKKVPGVTFRILEAPGGDIANWSPNLRFNGEVPLAAALQAIQDSSGPPQIGFVVREYGILVAPQERMPPGAVSVDALWKASTAGKHAPDPRAEPPKKK